MKKSAHTKLFWLLLALPLFSTCSWETHINQYQQKYGQYRPRRDKQRPVTGTYQFTRNDSTFLVKESRSAKGKVIFRGLSHSDILLADTIFQANGHPRRISQNLRCDTCTTRMFDRTSEIFFDKKGRALWKRIVQYYTNNLGQNESKMWIQYFSKKGALLPEKHLIEPKMDVLIKT